MNRAEQELFSMRVIQYYLCHGKFEALRHFVQEGARRTSITCRIIKRYEETGETNFKKIPGRPRTVSTFTNISKVKKLFEQACSTSTSGVEFITKQNNAPNVPQARGIEMFWDLCKKEYKKYTDIPQTLTSFKHRWTRLAKRVAATSGKVVMRRAAINMRKIGYKEGHPSLLYGMSACQRLAATCLLTRVRKIGAEAAGDAGGGHWRQKIDVYSILFRASAGMP
ncbi:hypothetical protein ACJJTC_018690 [Scirpophaga incertulas]